MDIFDLAEQGGTLEVALARVQAPRCLVIGVETDFLFPIEQQEEIAMYLRRAGRAVRFAPMSSVQGHDSFLVDHERFCPAVGEFLSEV
jgi:homoserine O-acetyltransferase